MKRASPGRFGGVDLIFGGVDLILTIVIGTCIYTHVYIYIYIYYIHVLRDKLIFVVYKHPDPEKHGPFRLL